MELMERNMIRYNHTAYGLLVDDIAEAVAFYRDTMGFHVLRQSDTFAQMDAGGTLAFFLWKWSHLCEHLGREAMQKVRHRTQSALRFERPDDVDRAYLALKEQGVNFVAAPGNWEWNARAAYFVDDNGYMWELFCWLK